MGSRKRQDLLSKLEAWGLLESVEEGWEKRKIYSSIKSILKIKKGKISLPNTLSFLMPVPEFKPKFILLQSTYF